MVFILGLINALSKSKGFVSGLWPPPIPYMIKMTIVTVLRRHSRDFTLSPGYYLKSRLKMIQLKLSSFIHIPGII